MKQQLGAVALAKAAQICFQRLAQKQLTVDQVFEPRAMIETIKALEKPYTTSQLHPDLNDFSSTNAFWLNIYSGADPGANDLGKLVGTSGARCDRIREGEFPAFFEDQLKRLYGGTEMVPLKSTDHPPEFADMRGTIVYLGDFFVLKDFRGSGFDKRFYTLLLYITAMMQWDFDWLYLFITEKHARNGYASDYCLTTSYPTSLLWTEAPSYRSDSDHLGLLSRHQFNWLIKRLLARPDLF